MISGAKVGSAGAGGGAGVNISGCPLAWCRARVKWGAHAKFRGDRLCRSGGLLPDLHFHLYIIDVTLGKCLPECPAREATLTTWPFLFSIMPGRKALMVQKCAKAFTSNVFMILAENNKKKIIELLWKHKKNNFDVIIYDLCLQSNVIGVYNFKIFTVY